VTLLKGVFYNGNGGGGGTKYTILSASLFIPLCVGICVSVYVVCSSIKRSKSGRKEGGLFFYKKYGQ
jgi:hypothetical protein